MHFERKLYLTGFTLVELLVVISIIGLFASIIVASMRGVRDKARLAIALEFADHTYHAFGADAVGIWNFGGGSYQDSLGNRRNLIPTGVVTPEVGVDGSLALNAVSFDGASYLLSADPPRIVQTSNQPWTIAAWIKPTSVSLPAGQIFLSTNVPYLRIASGSFRLHGNSGVLLLNGINNKRTDVWYYVAATYDGLGASGTVTMYVDGVSEAKGSIGTPFGINSRASIGAFPSGGQPVNAGTVIDDVRIYTQSLSASEVQKLYAEGILKRKLVRK
jgi:prepilin-type N-terminal cleavage/methylation domain-containing protein